MWSLPCPSLCYDPSLHGIPDLDRIQYTHSSTPVLVLLIIPQALIFVYHFLQSS